jgi:hypothetical protein
MTQEANRKATSVAADNEFLLEIAINAGIDAALGKGWEPNKIDKSRFTLMSFAAMSASPDGLRKVQAAGGNILLANGDGETVLHDAVSHGPYGYRFDTVNYILNEIDTHHKESKQSFINKQSNSGETALMESACHITRRGCDTVQEIQNSFKMQLLLLENGADPSIVSSEGHPESFLHNMIHMHYKTNYVVSRLAKQNISDELKEYFNSGSFDAGLKEVLTRAIENGLDINAKVGLSSTPIVQALQYCNIPLFKMLRELGAVKPEADSHSYIPNCDDSNDVAKMKCFTDNYDTIEKCEDSVKPAAEQAPAQDEL